MLKLLGDNKLGRSNFSWNRTNFKLQITKFKETLQQIGVLICARKFSYPTLYDEYYHSSFVSLMKNHRFHLSNVVRNFGYGIAITIELCNLAKFEGHSIKGSFRFSYHLTNVLNTISASPAKRLL